MQIGPKYFVQIRFKAANVILVQYKQVKEVARSHSRLVLKCYLA